MIERTLKSLVDKRIIASLAHVDQDEKTLSTEFVRGRIVEAGENGIKLSDGKEIIFVLPPYLDCIMEAPHGEYKHRASGEIDVDPDLICMWRLHHASPDGPVESWEEINNPLFSQRYQFDWDFTYRHDADYLHSLIESKGKDFIGKTLLAGVTHYSRPQDDEHFLSQEQFAGVIEKISVQDGMVIQLSDGTQRELPPDLSYLAPAAPGEYRLRSTGEVIIDPDYMTIWRVSHPPKPSK